jgi:hypothetical protein
MDIKKKEWVSFDYDKYETKSVPKDGNCFFHSILGSLGSISFPMEYRQNTIHQNLRTLLSGTLLQILFDIQGNTPVLDPFQSIPSSYMKICKDFVESKNITHYGLIDVNSKGISLYDRLASAIKTKPIASNIYHIFIHEYKNRIDLRYTAMLKNHLNIRGLLPINQKENPEIQHMAVTDCIYEYICKVSNDGIFVDLLIYGTIFAFLFNMTIHYCIVQGGELVWASQPITGFYCLLNELIPEMNKTTDLLGTDNNGEIYLANYVPKSYHYEYIKKKSDISANEPTVTKYRNVFDPNSPQMSQFSYKQPVKKACVLEKRTIFNLNTMDTIVKGIKEDFVMKQAVNPDMINCPQYIYLIGKNKLIDIPRGSLQCFLPGIFALDIYLSDENVLIYTLDMGKIHIPKDAPIFTSSKAFFMINRSIHIELDGVYDDFWNFYSSLWSIDPIAQDASRTIEKYRAQLKTDIELPKQYNSLLIKPQNDHMDFIFTVKDEKSIPSKLMIMVWLNEVPSREKEEEKIKSILL